MFEAYISELKKILDHIASSQVDAIKRAGVTVAVTLRNGGIVHTFGTGHSHLIAEEAFFRAGGIVPVNPILDERITFLRGALESTSAEREPGLAARLIGQGSINCGDVAIIISNSGRNAAPVEMAIELRSRTITIIAITSLEHSRSSPAVHSSGKRLFELADIVIDNGAPPGDALMSIRGLPVRLGPVSTITGSAIVHSIMMEAASELSRLGVTVPAFRSANLPETSNEDLAVLMRPYKDRIRYFDV